MAIDKDKVLELFGRYWEIAYNEGRTGEGFPDLANDVLAELRDALDADDGDVFTGQLVEIDGHEYALRPGAARIVREALRYRNALACIATVAATEHDYQELALRVLGETDHMKLIQWRNAAIDAAMAKDGA